MSKPEVIEKKPINMVELKSELAKIKKRDEELSFRGGRTIEYLNEFVTVKKKDAAELEGKLRKLGLSRLKNEFIHKIIDTMPKNLEELKLLLQGYTLSLGKEDMEKVMKVLKEYA
ncbi:hypothetical protein ACFL1B_02960 [Nanoarchaeota archaeon]